MASPFCGDFFVRGGEGNRFEKQFPSPPRAPPLPSQNFCRITVTPTRPGWASRACSVPRQHDKKRPDCRRLASDAAYLAFSPRSPPFPKTLPDQSLAPRPGRRCVPVPSPDGMIKKTPAAHAVRPAFLFSVWLGRSRASPGRPQRLASGQQSFSGDGGCGGKAPFVHKGGLPPTRKQPIGKSQKQRNAASRKQRGVPLCRFFCTPNLLRQGQLRRFFRAVAGRVRAVAWRRPRRGPAS